MALGASAARPGPAEEGKRVAGERKEAVVEGGQKEVVVGVGQMEGVADERMEAVVVGEQMEVAVEGEQRVVVEDGQREAAVAFWWLTCLARLEQGVAEARTCGCLQGW